MPEFVEIKGVARSVLPYDINQDASRDIVMFRLGCNLQPQKLRNNLAILSFHAVKGAGFWSIKRLCGLSTPGLKVIKLCASDR